MKPKVMPTVILFLVAVTQASAAGPAANSRAQAPHKGIWQSGKIIRAEQPKRRKPELEVWNPWLTHWYTIAAATETIKATDMVPAGVKRRGDTLSWDVDRDPPMAFHVGETVRFQLQDQPSDPKEKRELYILDRKGNKHVLTVDEMSSRAPQSRLPD